MKIMLADDHPLVRQALRNMLLKESDFEIVSEAKDGEEAIHFAAETTPDVIIMDISMPKINGLEATKYIKAHFPEIGILVLTVHSDNEHVLGILQAGADGFLTKAATDSEIIHALRALSAGDAVLSPDVFKQIIKYAFRSMKKIDNTRSQVKLTTRELEIIRMAAKGMANKDIALRLGIGSRSVKAHLTNLFLKLNVTSRTEAIAFSLQTGLLTLEDVS